jgi:uncharacterized protein with PIN domain
MPERICCQKCGRELATATAVLVQAKVSGTARHALALWLCRPCSVPVVDALRAVLEPRR